MLNEVDLTSSMDSDAGFNENKSGMSGTEEKITFVCKLLSVKLC